MDRFIYGSEIKDIARYRTSNIYCPLKSWLYSPDFKTNIRSQDSYIDFANLLRTPPKVLSNSGSFEPIFDLNLGGNIDSCILPPKFKVENRSK